MARHIAFRLSEEAQEAKAVEIKKIALQPWPRDVPERFWDMCYSYEEKTFDNFMKAVDKARKNSKVKHMELKLVEGSVAVLEMTLRRGGHLVVYRIDATTGPVFHPHQYTTR